MNHLLLTGATGRLGRTVQRVFTPTWVIHPRSRSGGDDLRTASPGDVVPEEADFVLNCAAMSSRGGCSRDSFSAYALNTRWPARLAGFCAASNRRLVHISTDLVYSGGSHPTSPVHRRCQGPSTDGPNCWETGQSFPGPLSLRCKDLGSHRHSRAPTPPSPRTSFPAGPPPSMLTASAITPTSMPLPPTWRAAFSLPPGALSSPPPLLHLPCRLRLLPPSQGHQPCLLLRAISP